MIPFNRPHLTGRELTYIAEAAASGVLSGNGAFTRRCQERLRERLGALAVLLTHSCTGALEMAALLSDVKPGDEVIMPSFTFVSTANAFVLRGATPVFVDIRPDTLNIDERLIEAAITSRTRAIVPVHYAGVPCEMDAITELARRHQLLVIEDAAQALGSTFRGRPVAGLGDFAAISFHETKNVIAGEGGALVINNPKFVERAEILWEKGTDRVRFFRGETSKYTWVDVGSSFLPSEITAAFLWAQLEREREITAERLALWDHYRRLTASLSMQPSHVPEHGRHNAHMFYVLLPRGADRADVLASLRSRGIHAVFHYVPLHSSPAGVRFGRTATPMPVTDDCSSRLIRLPLWIGMTPQNQAAVVDALQEALAALPR
jgi:dTDP-4-amino-4,6-dideoxygalactose transaminase